MHHRRITVFPCELCAVCVHTEWLPYIQLQVSAVRECNPLSAQVAEKRDYTWRSCYTCSLLSGRSVGGRSTSLVTNRVLLRARRPVRTVCETPNQGGVEADMSFRAGQRRDKEKHHKQTSKNKQRETTRKLENTILEAQVASRWDCMQSRSTKKQQQRTKPDSNIP